MEFQEGVVQLCRALTFISFPRAELVSWQSIIHGYYLRKKFFLHANPKLHGEMN
jgi:hypothetical protein